MQASSSLGKNMEVLIQNKAKNSTEEMEIVVKEAISNKQAPVRINKINMTYSRIASTASWFGTRGKSVNRRTCQSREKRQYFQPSKRDTADNCKPTGSL
jgi:primase-polymerase (primpol)-like protein